MEAMAVETEKRSPTIRKVMVPKTKRAINLLERLIVGRRLMGDDVATIVFSNSGWPW